MLTPKLLLVLACQRASADSTLESRTLVDRSPVAALVLRGLSSQHRELLVSPSPTSSPSPIPSPSTNPENPDLIEGSLDASPTRPSLPPTPPLQPPPPTRAAVAAVVGGLVLLLAGLVSCAVANYQRSQRVACLRDATFDTGRHESAEGILQIHDHIGAKACRMGSTTHGEAERMPTLISDDEKKILPV